MRNSREWLRACCLALGLVMSAGGIAAGAELNANERAANGPLPGDIGLYASELACIKAHPTPGYYPSLNGAEVGDAQRSGFYPCADFTGSWTGPNRVYAWKSEDTYQGTYFLNNRKPGELYLVGGVWPALTGPVAPGPYLAKVDATTGRQIWRTYFDNANVSGHWIGVANLNILPDGNIVFAWSDRIALVDGDTGLILKTNTLPLGDALDQNVSYKHVTIAPDGTLILKDQSRPVGETGQGSMAMIRGLQKGLKMANSELVAVDPNTLKVLDAVPLPEAAGSPHTITTFEGKIAIYIPGADHILRYFWDPATKKLSQDKAWVVSYREPGQTAGTAPAIMGNWIVITTNGPGSRVTASSVVAVNQADPSKKVTIFPFGPLKKGQFSFCLPKNGTDIENNMVYAADMGIGKVAGIRLDQATGAMKTVFVIDDKTTGFQPVVGPKDHRVLVLSNMKSDVPFEGPMVEVMTRLYREQVTWRDAATGRLLAASDFLPPMQLNALITPGFGGRFYYITDEGFIVLQVKPAE